MAEKSLAKFLNTIQQQAGEVIPDIEVMDKVLVKVQKPNLRACKISTGPTAVLQSTSKEGGGKAFLAKLCHRSNRYVIRREFDLFRFKHLLIS